MLAVIAAGGGHPVVAGVLGLGTVGLAGGVVAMAWSVQVRQIGLAEQLARRQLIVTGGAREGRGREAGIREGGAAVGGVGNGNAAVAAPVVIEGPDTVVAGEQARYRVRPSGTRTVVAWAAGGGPLAQCPDPAHPDELLLVADRPGTLAVTVRVREGMVESRGVKSVTAVPDVTDVVPSVMLRLFLRGWGLAAAAVLIIGFAGALVALGALASSSFIALVTPLAALLAVVAVVQPAGDAAGHPGHSNSTARPKP